MARRVREALGRNVAPPRFLAFLVLMPLAYWIERATFHTARWTSAAALAFDVAALAFLISLIPFLKRRGPDAIREHADANDANRVLVLAVTTLLAIVLMVAIAGELPDARHGRPLAVLILVGTLVLIWLFANTVYALHYAHCYYLGAGKDGSDCGGLDFPGDAEPEYGDFLYFSFTLGMTFQTSDVDITSSRVRLIVLLHCFVAFVFNLGVLAFTVNALAGGGS